MSNSLKVFPSSLSENWGRILTESNIKGILEFLQTNNNTILNSVIKGFEFNGVDGPGDENGIVSIKGGSALFEGYQVECLEDVYSNFSYPSGGPGVYYICLHLKFTTGTGGISDFVVCEDFDDFENTTVPTGSGSLDCPFIVVKDPGTFLEPQWSDSAIPDNLGIQNGIEPGYVYKYLPLYMITVESTDSDNLPKNIGTKTMSGNVVIDFSSIQSRLGREFIPLHVGAIGYIDDNLTNYFGTASQSEYFPDNRLSDWRNKYILSAGGNHNTLEDLLVGYIGFIHETVRGYNTDDYNLSGLTVEDAASNTLRFWNQTHDSNIFGDFLPIQNINNPRDSVVGHLRYDPDEIQKAITQNYSFDNVGISYVNEKIVRRSNILSTNVSEPDGPRFGEYIYENPTGNVTDAELYSYGPDYIVTLDSNNQVNRKFLPISTEDRIGLISIDTNYYTHEGGSPQKLFEYDESGLLKSYSPLFSITSLTTKTSGTQQGQTLGVSTNHTEVEFNNLKNKLNEDVIYASLVDLQNNTNSPKITLTLNEGNPISTAYGLKYSEDYLGVRSSNEFVINQDLLTTSSPIFTSLRLQKVDGDGSLLYVDSISTNTNNSNLSINNSVQVSGTLTATKVYNAVYNDYAELFKKNQRVSLTPGDIIAMDIEDGVYTLARPQDNHMVVGVYSDTYGHLLGGDGENTLEQNLEEYIPIGLAGRVFVKVFGPISKGDLITLSTTYSGIGVKVEGDPIPGTIIGKCLVDKDSEAIERVEMLIMLQ